MKSGRMGNRITLSHWKWLGRDILEGNSGQCFVLSHC